MKPSKLPILTVEKDRAFLETASQPVDLPITEKTKQLAQNMIASMKDAKGIGIAAPQVGEHLRMFIVSPKDEPTIMINPEITWKSSKTTVDSEGCLSIPHTYGNVERAFKIKVKYFDLEGNKHSITAKGMFARIIQHEYDHIEGVLFTSKAENVYTVTPEEEN